MDWLIAIAIGIVCGGESALIVAFIPAEEGE